MRKDEECQPAFSQGLTGSGITQKQIEFGMVEMVHGTGVFTMQTDCAFRLMHVVFERIGSARSFANQDLFIAGFVVLHLGVKRPLANWFKVLLFGPVEIFAVGSSFRFAGDGIVVGF